MKPRMLVLAFVAALLCGMTAYAHHSFAGTYNLKKEVKIEGKLIRLLWRNPHSFVQVEAPDEAGKMQQWSVEWTGLPQLAGAGVTSSTLQVGDPVIITGNPTRTPGEYRMRMLTFKRTSDGFTWGTRRGEVVE